MGTAHSSETPVTFYQTARGYIPESRKLHLSCPSQRQVCYTSTGTGGKRSGREADRSPSTSAEIKQTWIYTSTSLYVIMA
jgi:hypothetical protein